MRPCPRARPAAAPGRSARTVSPVCTATGGRPRKKLRLKEAQASPGHTARKWQDCNLEAAPCGCKALMSRPDHTNSRENSPPALTMGPRSFTQETGLTLLTALRGGMPRIPLPRGGAGGYLPEHTRREEAELGFQPVPTALALHWLPTKEEDKPGRGLGVSLVLEETRKQLLKHPCLQSWVPGSADGPRRPLPAAPAPLCPSAAVSAPPPAWPPR